MDCYWGASYNHLFGSLAFFETSIFVQDNSNLPLCYLDIFRNSTRSCGFLNMNLKHSISRRFHSAIRLIIFGRMVVLCACAQDDTNALSRQASPEMTSKQRLQALKFTTPAYNKEALRLMLNEANSVARELDLQEAIPITESNLVAKH